MSSGLNIRNLVVSTAGTTILSGVDLDVPAGEVHALMGPNGGGKSTLAYSLMGHPAYKVESGTITFDGVDITAMPPDERARHGLFLSLQYPTAIPGVTVTNFLRAALRAHGRELPAREFIAKMNQEMTALSIDASFKSRYINDGFSGGEKKRSEILQMALIQPRLAILDETDSGLDVDALRIVAKGIERLRTKDMGVLVITHYCRILDYLTPDYVHVLAKGRIVASGGADLATRIEKEGYDPILSAPAGASV